MVTRLGFLLAAMLTLSCGSSSGPYDGNYTITTWTCGGTDVLAFLTSGTVTTIELRVSNLTGSTVVTYSGGCVRTQPIAFSYPSSTTATLVESAPSCSSACTNQCTGYTSATSTYTLALSGNTLTTTRTLTA